MKKLLQIALWTYVGLSPLVAGFWIHKTYLANQQQVDYPHRIDFRVIRLLQQALDEGLLHSNGLPQTKTKLEALGLNPSATRDEVTGQPVLHVTLGRAGDADFTEIVAILRLNSSSEIELEMSDWSKGAILFVPWMNDHE